MRAVDKVGAGRRVLDVAPVVSALKELLVGIGHGRPGVGDVEQVDEEVIGELAGACGEDAVTGTVIVGIEGTHAADQDRHLRGSEGK